MTIIERPVRPANTATGLAIILLPVVALAVKFITPGWMLVILFYAGIVLAALYVFLVVMAASGFFGRRAAFSFVPSVRGRIAGLGHGFGVLLFMASIPDGGDTGEWSSPIITVFGLDRDAFGSTTEALTGVGLVIAVVGYLWFVVEWAIALRVKRRLV
jgi:hypothetical protein